MFAAPATVPLTVRVTVQLAPAAMLAPESDAVPPPEAAAVIPPQVEFRLFGVATTTVPGADAGKLSVKETEPSVRFRLLFERVSVTPLVCPNLMDGAAKDFAIRGGLITVRAADDVFPLPTSLESMVTELLYTLSTVLATFTWMVHVPAANAELAKPMLPLPGVAVTAPPQLFTTAGGEATVRLPGTVPRLAGRMSIKLAWIGAAPGLVMANVIVAGEPGATAGALKLIAIEGDWTIRIAPLAVPPLETASPEDAAV